MIHDEIHTSGTRETDHKREIKSKMKLTRNYDAFFTI